MKGFMSKATQITADKNTSEIPGILYQLDLQLEKFITEVKRSYALYKVGQKTDFVKNIEKSLQANPIDSLTSLAENIDEQVLFFLNDQVEHFFKHKASLLTSAHKIRTERKLDLYYLLVLKQDSMDNREILFSFLDEYDLKPISRKYPIYFKFTTEALLPGFNIEKTIDI